MSKSERVELRLPFDLLEQIDEWRGGQSDVPNRSEAVRRLAAAGLSGNHAQQLFEIARLQIKLAAANPAIASQLPPSYVYAWVWRLYPVNNDIDGIAKSFESCFDICAEQVCELLQFLDDRWLEQSPITFYELERHFDARGRGVRWDRSKLISVCRYFFLNQYFDNEFWMHLLARMEHPSEAASITRPVDEELQIYFA